MSAENAAPELQKAGVPLQNAKHESVLQAYLADAERVGYRCYISVYPNSSEPAAKTAFSRLLKNADFAARFAFLNAAVTEKVVEQSAVTIERVIAELAKIGFANIKDFIRVTPDGDPAIDFSELDEVKGAALASVTVEDFKDGRGDDARDVRKISFRLFDKRAALVDIGKHLGAFVDKHADPDGRALGTGAAEAAAKASEVSELELARRIAFALEQGARAAVKEAPPAPAKPGKVSSKKSKRRS